MYAEVLTTAGLLKAFGLTIVYIFIISIFMFLMLTTKNKETNKRNKLNILLGTLLSLITLSMAYVQLNETFNLRNLETSQEIIYLKDYEKYVDTKSVKGFQSFYFAEDDKGEFYMIDESLYKYLEENGFGCYISNLSEEEMKFNLSSITIEMKAILYLEKQNRDVCKKAL